MYILSQISKNKYSKKNKRRFTNKASKIGTKSQQKAKSTAAAERKLLEGELQITP